MSLLRQSAEFTVADLLADWTVSLRAQGRARLTIESYTSVARSLDAYLLQRGMPREVASIRREHVEAWLADMGDRCAPATVARHYRSAQQLFRWLLGDGEIATSPMARMRPPKVPQKRVPVLTEEEIAALLRACRGPTFENRRDEALMRFLLDTGCRASEVIRLRVEDVDIVAGLARVTGKGGHERTVALGLKTCEALRRYLRLRARSGLKTAAGSPMWLGKKGALGDSGLRQMLERRGADAGVAGVHPHRFRHSFAHRWLAAGGQETDLMELAGWKSRQMVHRYGSSAAAARAIEAHRRMALGDV
jgi:site-specific recombinase XerD